MKFELEKYHRNTPPEDLIADIKYVAKKLSKKSITVVEYAKYGKYGIQTYFRRFGSWSNALEAANLKIDRKINISDKKLFKNLEDVWIKLGRQPRCEEIRKPLSQFSTNPYTQHFGSWRGALEKFISYINLESVNEDEIVNNDSEADIKVENAETILR